MIGGDQWSYRICCTGDIYAAVWHLPQTTCLTSYTPCRWIVYRRALDLLSQVEDELLRVSTYHMEQYTRQLQEAGGSGSEAGSDLDRAAVLDDAWSFEAGYQAAKYRALLAYLASYRHSEAWGVMHDLFAGLGEAQGGLMGPVATDIGASGRIAVRGGTPLRPFAGRAAGGGGGGGGGSGSAERWSGVAVNTPQPQLLAARVQLRREILDLCFRRPGISVEDGYFASRYISATVTLELEGGLVERLTAAVAAEERQALAVAFTTSTSAAAAAVAPSPSSAAGEAWHPGLPLAMLYGALMRGSSSSSRGLMQEGAVLAGVGAAAAAIPGQIRQVVSALCDVHQVVWRRGFLVTEVTAIASQRFVLNVFA